MPQTRRARPASEQASDREARAEALLLAGLDRYLLGHFEDAIHVWTRVLFLDRSHPRARAYIDRARSAIAERQRGADELLHVTDELLTMGQAAEARRVLGEVVRATGDDERAALLRTRLERLERAGVVVPDAARGPVGLPQPPAASGRVWRTSRLVATGIAAMALVWLGGAAWALLRADATVPPLATPSSARPLPVLSSVDVALVRAETLYARGRLAEALRVLDSVGPGSARRGEADELRIRIQRVLLGDAPASIEGRAARTPSGASRP